MYDISQWSNIEKKYLEEKSEKKLLVLKRLRAVTKVNDGILPSRFRINVNFRKEKIDEEELNQIMTEVLKDVKYNKWHVLNYKKIKGTWNIEITEPLRAHKKKH